MIRIFIFISLFLSMAACDDTTIILVTVRDSEFHEIKTLTSTAELAAFSELWSKRQKEPDREPASFSYKIDIQTTSGSGNRWLYDPAGVAQILTKTVVPGYRIDSPERFNTLLGIEAK
jgi:hypothetical protein